MVENGDPATSRREKLNRIAQHRTQNGNLPDSVTWDDVSEDAAALYDELKALIGAYETKTRLTIEQAETWALRTTVGAQNDVLSHDGVALVLAAPDTPFEASTRSEGAVAVSDIEQVLADAAVTVEQARRLITLNECPEYAREFDAPSIVLLDAETKHRLKRLKTPADDTLADVVTRTIAEAETHRDLDAFGEALLDAIGRDNVEQITVDEQSLRGGQLLLTVHGRELQDVPAVVTDTDAVRIAGVQYDVHVEYDPYGPTDHNRITLYGVDPAFPQTDEPVAHVTLAEGVDAAQAAVTDLVEQDDEPDPGTSVA